MEKLRYKNRLFFEIEFWIRKIWHFINNRRFDDRTFISKIFEKAHGYKMDFNSPLSLNQKLQWIKLNDKRDLFVQHADKIEVRDFIRDYIGEEYVIPLYGVYSDFSEIPQRELPLPCIIKTNHDSGNYVIVRDIENINWDKVKYDFIWALRVDYYWFQREWQYQKIERRILVEQLLSDESGRIPDDFKFNCFNGKVEFIYVANDREGENRRFIFNKDWELLPFSWGSKWKEKSSSESVPAIPSNLEQMIIIAEKIAQYYLYVRVDLYSLNNRIYVGEITHTHGGGFDRIYPKEWDFQLGEKLKIGKELLDQLPAISKSNNP
jgi:hypothetical protein